jgi:phosphonate transport system ATP-binding protein
MLSTRDGGSDDDAAHAADRAARAGDGPRRALALSRAERRYGPVQALRPVTLSIRPGERVAVVGPSGAGKSTLLGLLNTSLAPSSGAVEVLGQAVADLSPRALRALRARVGTVYQQLQLVPQATVMQNVVAGRLGRMSVGRALLSLLSRREAERVAAVLARVGIADRIYERVDRLSGGEQQRVAIARALYQDPEIVVADEPLASVDPARAAEIIELLARTFAGRTLVVTTHRLEPFLPHVGRVIGLREGALVFDKPTPALTLDDLAHLYASSRGAPASSPAVDRAIPAEPPGGILTIGASNTPGEFMLPAAVRSFVRQYPGVHVRLGVKDSAEIVADLLAGKVDLGFVGARSPHPDLHFEDFADDEIVLVASPALCGLPPAPLSPEAVGRLPRVEREEGSGTRAVVEEHFANLGAPLDTSAVALHVGTLVGLKAAVLSGIGVAFTSRAAVRDDLEEGHLVALRIASVKIPRRIFVAWRRDRELPLAARRFLDVARQEGPGRRARAEDAARRDRPRPGAAPEQDGLGEGGA